MKENCDTKVRYWEICFALLELLKLEIGSFMNVYPESDKNNAFCNIQKTHVYFFQ